MHFNPDHRLEPLVIGDSCKIWRCSCGTYHLQIQHVCLRVSPETFLEVCRSLGLASEPLLAGAYRN